MWAPEHMYIKMVDSCSSISSRDCNNRAVLHCVLRDSTSPVVVESGGASALVLSQLGRSSDEGSKSETRNEPCTKT
jgi:hypothetical protein